MALDVSLTHLELYRPVLLALDQHIRALTVELITAAPAALPKGMGALSTVVISREIFSTITLISFFQNLTRATHFRDHVPFACREIAERPAPVVRSAELEDSALDGCLGKSANSSRAEFACDRTNKKWPFCERPLLILLSSVWVNELLNFKRSASARRQGRQEHFPVALGSFHRQEQG